MAGKYGYIKIKPAENGWVLSYDEHMQNPMEAMSTYGYNSSVVEKKLVFESDGSKTGVDKALDEALAKQKTMLIENRDMMMEYTKSMSSHNSHNSHKKTY